MGSAIVVNGSFSPSSLPSTSLLEHLRTQVKYLTPRIASLTATNAINNVIAQHSYTVSSSVRCCMASCCSTAVLLPHWKQRQVVCKLRSCVTASAVRLTSYTQRYFHSFNSILLPTKAFQYLILSQRIQLQ